MMPKSGSNIRPMLRLTKDEIMGYMLNNAFEWREDTSNKDTSYKRNAVRHDLVPVLEKLTGSKVALYRQACTIDD